jgi:2-dehydropantoate 2-reductase
MSQIAILGAGGVGGFLAGALERAGKPVTIVAREPTAAVIDRDGLTVRSVRLGRFVARPAAVTRLAGPTDALIVATKATGLEAALDRIETEPRLVVPLLNGLDHLGVLRARFGDTVAAATIRIEADRPSTGRIMQTSPFLGVDIAAHRHAEAFAALLESADVPARVLASEADVMWGKLVRLNALALTTSAHDLPLGRIRDTPELRAELEACVSEGAAVARAEGAGVLAATVMEELDDAHASLRSSMQRDIAASREPELDAIAGSVLRAAARHSLECTTIAHLATRVALRAGVAAPVPTG